MSFPSLKQRLADGQTVNVFAVSRLFHPNMIEVYGLHGGFHGFWIDDEHAGFSVREIETATAFGRAAGLDSFVRIPPTDYATVTRCLESGAGGVMAAQISTAEQAEEFVRWSKFVPRGNRGMNAGGFDGRFGNLGLAEFCANANRDSFVAIQIETVSAVDQCDEIAAIDGVDLLFVGPADLSQALHVPGEFLHEKCLAAVDRVAAACDKNGKTFGAVTTTAEHSKMLVDKGCRMLSPTNDVRTFNAGVKSVKQTFAHLFE
ncbi:MAG: host specificity protein [Planctomycetaceae bacterium]|nr:host specificity protein [Planctomycetaceae bacterium]